VRGFLGGDEKMGKQKIDFWFDQSNLEPMFNKKQKAIQVAKIIGGGMALDNKPLFQGMPVERAAKVAVSQMVGDFDPGFRKNLGLTARLLFKKFSDKG
jgi:hypothetical protein